MLAVFALVLWIVAATGSVSAVETAARKSDPGSRNDAPTAGLLIKVPAPITDLVEKRVRRAVSRALARETSAGRDLTLVLEIESGPTDFGNALDLAKFLAGPSLSGVRTVAYLPASLKGHGVLVAMACQQIIMPADAELGAAGESESVLGPDLRTGYALIASQRQTIPVDLALGMLDPALEVLDVETETGHELVLSQRLDEVRANREIVSTRVVKRGGEPGLLSGQQLRELGLVSFLADDRLAMAQALDLPRSAVQEDLSLADEWRAVRINVQGPIGASTVGHVRRLIAEQIRARGANLIVLWIESPGGSPIESLNLANYLADLDPAQCRTVAYLAGNVRGDAALIPLGCDHVVIRNGAVWGGPGAYEPSADEAATVAHSAAEIARRKLHSPALAAALFDPDRTVHAYTRADDGRVEYFDAEALARQPQPQQWVRGESVGQPGRVLALSAARAEELGLARLAVDDYAQLKSAYGLEQDPLAVEPGWVDHLVLALASPGLASILLLVGFLALVTELKAPGIGVAGIVATLCFLVFFWSRYLGGTADWLEILMFLTGLGFVAIEFFVLPGFGVFGLVGGALILGSLVLAGQTFVLPQNSYQLAALRDQVVAVAVSLGAALATLVVFRSYLPKSRLFQVLGVPPLSPAEAAEIERRETTAHFEDLVGQQGVVVTRLVPAGKIRVGQRIIDVVAQGEIIEPDEPVEIVAARGNRVVVRRAT